MTGDANERYAEVGDYAINAKGAGECYRFERSRIFRNSFGPRINCRLRAWRSCFDSSGLKSLSTRSPASFEAFDAALRLRRRDAGSDPSPNSTNRRIASDRDGAPACASRHSSIAFNSESRQSTAVGLGVPLVLCRPRAILVPRVDPLMMTYRSRSRMLAICGGAHLFGRSSLWSLCSAAVRYAPAMAA
jgi:hypothetical protein